MNGKNNSNLGNKIIFSENLKYYLSLSGQLQKDIAVVAKVSQGTITDWLQARSYPRMDKIQLLAEHFGIEMSDLVEKRSVDNKYYLQKEAQMIANDLAKSPNTLLVFQNFQKLSPANRKIVEAMINSLAGGNE
jgi:transcriptional regulator with XRE-family HTH domain